MMRGSRHWCGRSRRPVRGGRCSGVIADIDQSSRSLGCGASSDQSIVRPSSRGGSGLEPALRHPEFAKLHRKWNGRLLVTAAAGDPLDPAKQLGIEESAGSN